jgi:hypothetical protein
MIITENFEERALGGGAESVRFSEVRYLNLKSDGYLLLELGNPNISAATLIFLLLILYGRQTLTDKTDTDGQNRHCK